MATQANLIATYQSNPTLQKQYTLDQYLALFDFSQTPTTPTPTPTPTPVTPGIPNIINQNINQGGGEGDGGSPPGPTDPYAGLGYSSANFGLGKETIGDFVNKDVVTDYEADAYEVGRTLPGQLSKFGLAAFNAFKNIPTPFNLMRKAYEFTKQKDIEKKEQEAAIARENFREAMRQGQGFYDSLNEGRGASVSRESREQAGPGYGDVSESASFADGGRVYLYNRLK